MFVVIVKAKAEPGMAAQTSGSELDSRDDSDLTPRTAADVTDVQTAHESRHLEYDPDPVIIDDEPIAPTKASKKSKVGIEGPLYQQCINFSGKPCTRIS